MAFTRTATGLVAKYRFYDIPTVWVEGPTDIHFYEPVLDRFEIRMDSYGGKENAKELIKALKIDNHPYVVITDGDYEILRRNRSVHRRVVMLHRYSFENYLWEKTSLEKACLKYACCGDKENILESDYENALEAICTNLYQLVVLDVACRDSESGTKVMPDRPDVLLKKKSGVEFDNVKIKKLQTRATAKLTEKSVNQARALVDTFLSSHHLVYILRGHFAFGLLRRLFIQTVARMRKKPKLEDDAIIQILAVEVWKLIPSDDHRNLKRRLYRAIKEASKYFNEYKESLNFLVK